MQLSNHIIVRGFWSSGFKLNVRLCLHKVRQVALTCSRLSRHRARSIHVEQMGINVQDRLNLLLFACDLTIRHSKLKRQLNKPKGKIKRKDIFYTRIQLSLTVAEYIYFSLFFLFFPGNQGKASLPLQLLNFVFLMQNTLYICKQTNHYKEETYNLMDNYDNYPIVIQIVFLHPFLNCLVHCTVLTSITNYPFWEYLRTKAILGVLYTLYFTDRKIEKWLTSTSYLIWRWRRASGLYQLIMRLCRKRGES
jgi:hypothetical protein